MTDFYVPFLLIALIAVIIIQAIERYFYGESMQREQTRLVTAILSKNATDYSIATKIEKSPSLPKENPDEVELANADDETFLKHISGQKS